MGSRPTLDDARIQLEGGLEALAAWSEDFDTVASDLKSGEWRSWLDAHRHVWDRVIARERELSPTLAKARRLAEASAALAGWLKKWDARRNAVFRKAEKIHLLKADTFAELRAGLRARPVPPRVEFDNRETVWELTLNSHFLPLPTRKAVVVNTERIELDRQFVLLPAVHSVAIVGLDVTVRLKNGETLLATLRPEDADPFAKALGRVGVSVVYS